MNEQDQPSETAVEIEINGAEESVETPVEEVLQELTVESVQAELELALARIDEQQADVLRAQADVQKFAVVVSKMWLRRINLAKKNS